MLQVRELLVEPDDRGTESAGAQSAQEGDERKKEECRQHRAPRQRLQGDPKADKKGDRL